MDPCSHGLTALQYCFLCFAQTAVFSLPSLVLGWDDGRELLVEYFYHRGGSHLLNKIIPFIQTQPDASFETLFQQSHSLANTVEALQVDFHRIVVHILGLE